MSPNFKPIEIRGVLYPSRKAAAEALGVIPSAVSNAYRAGTEQTCGLGYKAPVSCIIDGVHYPSIVAASRGTGIPYNKLWDTLRRQEKALPHEAAGQVSQGEMHADEPEGSRLHFSGKGPALFGDMPNVDNVGAL